MKLNDLRPQNVDFEVCGLSLTFRPFTIADDLKAHDICGGQDKMFEAFNKFDFKIISLVAWYQLMLESQKKIVQAVEGFAKDPVTNDICLHPETGEEIKVNLTPIDKFRNLFIGIGDQISLITNLVKCKGLNVPDLDDDASLKKWIDQLEKVIPSTGQ